MDKISNLEYERNRYCKLRDDIVKISSLLNNNINNLDISSIELDNNYLINDKSIDNNIFNDNITKIEKITGILNDTIIPSINDKIEQLTNEIMAKQEMRIMK